MEKGTKLTEEQKLKEEQALVKPVKNILFNYLIQSSSLALEVIIL